MMNECCYVLNQGAFRLPYGNGNGAHQIHVHIQNHLTLLGSLSLFFWIKCRKNYGKWVAVSKSREQRGNRGHRATRRHAISVSARSGISLSRALRAACPICLLVFALISSLISATLVCLPSVCPTVPPSSLLSTRLFSLFAVRLSKHNLSLIILCVRTYTGCLQGFHSKLNIIVMTVPHTVDTHMQTQT